MRLIDADALKRQIQQGIDPHNFSAVMAAGAFFGEVNKLPTVDAVPVVRCKECKMWNTEWNHEAGDCYCYKFFQFTDPDFFCAAGKRREADGKGD